MNEQTARRLYSIVRWLTALAAVLTAFTLIAEALSIYLAAEKPMYSPEKATRGLARAAIPALMLLVLSIAGLLLKHKVGAGAETCTPDAQNRLRLAVKSVGRDNPIVQSAIGRLERIRLCSSALITALLGYSALYLSDRTNFTSLQLNDMLLSLFYHTLPGVMGALIVVGVKQFLMDRTAEKAVQDLKQVQSAHRQGAQEPESPSRAPLIRAVILTAAVILIVYGICNKGLNDVLQKAKAICTECIGLG